MDDARLIYHQKTNHHLPRRITDREPVQDYFSFRPAGWKVISLPRRPLPRTEKNGSSLCGGRKRALSFVLALFFYSIPIITGFFSFVKRLTGKIRKKRFLRACGMTAPACGANLWRLYLRFAISEPNVCPYCGYDLNADEPTPEERLAWNGDPSGRHAEKRKDEQTKREEARSSDKQ